MKANLPKKPSRIYQCLALSAPLLLLASCAAPAMRNQFVNYNEAYADSLNKQMLLNLARLQNGHPAYYLAIGLIDNKYTFSSQTSAGLSGSAQDTHTSTANSPFVSGTPSGIASFPFRVIQTVYQSVFGGSANETATVSSNPEFQFIPINNEAAAKQVLEPMDPNVFMSLYQQGYPIDQLMRIMVERVETPTLASGEQFVLVNSPTTGTTNSYERFLRDCAMLRSLQKEGKMMLISQSGLDPLGPVSFSAKKTSPDPEKPSPDPEKNGHNPNGGGGENSAYPALSDFVDAENNHLVLSATNNGWMAYRKREMPKFFLRGSSMITNTTAETDLQQMAAAANPLIEILKTNIYPNLAPSSDTNENLTAITNVVYALYMGISIQTDFGSGDTNTTRLILRSFNRSMEAVASEENCFNALSTNADFINMIPESERRPILQMVWTNKPADLERPLELVAYGNKTYQITDRKTPDPFAPWATWNRDSFRLLVDLNSQVTVDISKFQRQVLELEQ